MSALFGACKPSADECLQGQTVSRSCDWLYIRSSFVYEPITARLEYASEVERLDICHLADEAGNSWMAPCESTLSRTFFVYSTIGCPTPL